MTPEQVTQTFINTPLEENYNFLEADLVKLANAFIDAATPDIAKAERAECLKIARSVNYLVAEKIEEIRGKV